MKHLICTVITIALRYVADVGSQIPVVTYQGNVNQSLVFTFDGQPFAVTWRDIGASTDLATYGPQSNEIVVDNEGGKYENFNYSAFGSNFNLAIINVEKEDGGRYRCEQSPGEKEVVYDVIVEVPPENVLASCVSCSKENSFCNCQCSASGVSSPSIITLEWKINDESLFEQPPTVNSTNGQGQIVYLSDAVVPSNEDGSVIKCTVTGFENQEEITALFPSSIETELTLRSPDCTVSVSDDKCPTTAELSCECNGNPSVQGPYAYYSRNGSEDTGNDKLLSSSSYNVNLEDDSETYFVCMGDNGLDLSQKSEAVLNPCQKGTTILPTTSEPTSDTTSLDITTNSTANNAQPTGSTTTTKKDNGTGTENGDNNPPVVVIVVIVIVVIIILITVGGFIYWMVFKRNKNRTESKNDKTDGNGMQMSEAPEYAAVSKPLNSEPKPAPRSSQPPPTNSTEKQELQYADIDHSNRTPSNQIRQPAEAPTEYATVQSVIV